MDARERHLEWLGRMATPPDGNMPGVIIPVAMAFWDSFEWKPAAGVTEDGRLIYTWDRTLSRVQNEWQRVEMRQHLEVEFPKKGPPQWYGRVLVAGKEVFDSYYEGLGVPGWAVDMLRTEVK